MTVVDGLLGNMSGTVYGEQVTADGLVNRPDRVRILS
jgi:hypothetical protein